jgi:hypothetical protein
MEHCAEFIHHSLKMDPLLALWPILFAMALVLLGNWLVKKHYEVNGIDAPNIMGRPFHGWLPPADCRVRTATFRKAAIAVMVLLYALIVQMVLMGMAYNHIERTGRGLQQPQPLHHSHHILPLQLQVFGV